MLYITCINKDNGDHYDPHEAIESLGWSNTLTGKVGISERSDIIAFIKQGGKAFVRDRYGNLALLVVRIRSGQEYVKTVADGRETNNLLALNECSI